MSDTKLCPHCGTRYEGQGATSCPRDGAQLFTLPAEDGDAGKVLAGKFRLVRLLGKGGFGAVYEAVNLGLDRPVAIKVLRPEIAADAISLRRFLNEAKLVTRLKHPHTVTTYDLYQDESSGGTLLLAMELLEGKTLQEVLERRGRLAWREALDIAVQVCEALEEAHARKIVHRDLKPANIMLCEMFGRKDFVKVLDFGIAKAFEGAENVSLTTSGFVGTPAYMSPEHIAGKKLDGRSDIYSLGAVLYEMLTGRLPFDAASTTALLQAKAGSRPPVPGEACDGAEFPSGLEQLVMSMVGLHPEERPANVATLIACMQALLAGDEGSSLLDQQFATRETVALKEEGAGETMHPPAGGAEPRPTVVGGRRSVHRWAPIAWGAAAVLATGLTLVLWAPWLGKGTSGTSSSQSPSGSTRKPDVSSASISGSEKTLKLDVKLEPASAEASAGSKVAARSDPWGEQQLDVKTETAFAPALAPGRDSEAALPVKFEPSRESKARPAPGSEPGPKAASKEKPHEAELGKNGKEAGVGAVDVDVEGEGEAEVAGPAVPEAGISGRKGEEKAVPEAESPLEGASEPDPRQTPEEHHKGMSDKLDRELGR